MVMHSFAVANSHSLLRALLLGLFLLPCAARGEEAAPPRSLALLVGVSEYPHLRERHGEELYRRQIRLNGPENDVSLMTATLVECLGFDPKAIESLAGWPEDPARRPTRDNVVAALQRLAATVHKGDRVVILMAGHGSQQPDAEEDEPDGLDEIFLCADAQGWDFKRGVVPNSITDDELGDLVRAIRDAGALVWIIMDCCHSGTMMRGAEEEERSRRLDSDLLGVPAAAASRGAGDDSDKKSSLGSGGLERIVAMYAAQSYRTAPEMSLPKRSPDAKPHGLFSFTIAARLRASGGGLTYEELHSQVLAAYQALPYHNTVPLAEGGALREKVTGGEGSVALLVREAEGELLLNAGRLTDVVPGTVLEIFRPGRAGEADASLGFVRVVEADLTTAKCERVERDGKTLPKLTGDLRLCPSRVVERPAPDYRLKVFPVSADGTALDPAALPEEVRAVFRDYGARFPLMEKRADADWLLVVDGEQLSLQPATGGSGPKRFAVTAETLLDTMGQIFRVENLKRLAGGGYAERLASGLKVELLRVLPDGKTESMEEGGRLRPGERVQLRLQNDSGRSYYVTVLVIDAHYGLSVLFPRRFSTPELSHVDRKEVVIGPIPVNDSTLGVEHLLVLAVPRSEGDSVVDFSWLATESLTVRAGEEPKHRGPKEGGPFGDLLAELAFGNGLAKSKTRGFDGVPAGEAVLGLISWRTEWGRVQPADEAGAAMSSTTSARPTGDLAPRTQPEPWHPASDDTRPRGDLTALYAKVAPAIVVVRTRTGHGTGFLIDDEGHILTNHHVIANGFTYSKGGRMRVQIHLGTLDADGIMRIDEQPVEVEIVLDDPQRDLALLRVPDPATRLEGRTPIAFSDSNPRPGQACVMVGHPASAMLWSLREGNVAGIGRSPHDLVDILLRGLILSGAQAEEMKSQLQSTTPVKIVLSSCQGNPGDSGGPLVDEEGRLLGVTFAIPTEVRTDKFVYHVHIDEVKAFLRDRPEPKAESKPAPPDPWQIGPNVQTRRTPYSKSGCDLLLAGRMVERTDAKGGAAFNTEQVFIDVDGDTGGDLSDEQTVMRVVSTRAFEAEIVLHFLGDRRVAFYDTKNSGVFDLILVDLDEDPEADVRFRLVDGAWQVETDIAVPWLQSTYLEDPRLQKLALQKLQVVAK
ncbi:MAG: trypsin-like peptidase domain-containing protein [Planctomycetaceae bacterium]